MTTDRSDIPFKRLVQDCWSLLKGDCYAVFPTTVRSHPSQVVYLEPVNMDEGWYGPFWEEVVVPVLSELVLHTPTYTNGWKNFQSKGTVEAYLRRGLTGSSWASSVDYEAG